MSEIIQIFDYNGKTAVSARELHKFLEVKEKFTDWMKRMIEYGFIENRDYVIGFSDISDKPQGGRPSIDYILTLDTAKEISMIQRTEKGKQARQYFIECERIANPLAQNGDMVILQAMQLLQSRIEQQNQQMKSLIPKADYVDRITSSNTLFRTTVIAKEFGMTAYELNSILHELKVQYKVGDTWVLYKEHQGRGYEFMDTEIYNGHTVRVLKWTEYGRAFIHNKIKSLKRL
ncbi:Phage anti-repressor protein [Sphingobacterium multivorum]|uniref:antA/AntB antirepressor family protein n=1 Tax=Sphingobacterium multivorum TaxID=28454 RepID=UPI000DFCEF46|nr:antA/AntB antirepressor family protein [Sphingobacterium multivorum]QQT43344.1 antA/AntB antirepressor family protein [Sphingobacterium multivorum]SUI98501.1 Phage anti-repressor protein [Sphingobacterium multivorum]